MTTIKGALAISTALACLYGLAWGQSVFQDAPPAQDPDYGRGHGYNKSSRTGGVLGLHTTATKKGGTRTTPPRREKHPSGGSMGGSSSGR